MSDWRFDSIEVKDGFLSNLNLPLSPRLTCIIGPRGSGKSTLASALRFCLVGIEGANKQRLDLFKANLAKAIVIVKASRQDGSSYVIRREGREAPILTAESGQALSSIDLDRGTFLPLDAYSAGEIEDIANEQLGPRRRMLLDQLRPADYQGLLDQIAEAKRQLYANADQIRAIDRNLISLQEQLSTVADAPARLAALGELKAQTPEAAALQVAARQDQLSLHEAKVAAKASGDVQALAARIQDLRDKAKSMVDSRSPSSESRNIDLMARIAKAHTELLARVEFHATEIVRALSAAEDELAAVQQLLLERHAQQVAAYAKLKETNEAVGRAAKERAELEQSVIKLTAISDGIKVAGEQRKGLLQARMQLRARYIGYGDQLSAHRSTIASSLQEETGDRVRIKLRRSADLSEYILKLSEGLKGAGVSRHESIVEAVVSLRPDELAQLLTTRNYAEFETVTGLESERARRVLDSFRQAVDPFDLELVRPDDLVSIELNVGMSQELYKDAAHLSQGQKCTALLPLLLARRTVPLVIDQPEDNLDNHFIYETVVKSILRMKDRRQMIFVTHNANIPVLAEAELIVVLSSDGNVTKVEKLGSVDECKNEIIDLLEGGEEAFALRQKRYERS